ncbi:hypothetical protein ASD38_02355 [Caulobacter sp. Root487D2Y]|uniref:hypothetical protein n=1 Tax=Caulobacter sp. Root487D2Y TaxID=1736547 RepID=UPI0006F7376E|nr:hypothetical protein [Caulobacter sp. Root487D2Y]KQY35424.1 hypothetical protein ASD38_02355 [Caulobacter sp. Root487D2Y]
MTNAVRLLTLSSLLEVPQRLVISCYKCSRAPLYLSPEDAVARYGADTTFAALRRRLRCEACGARGRDRQIDVRGCTNDYYDAMERHKHQTNVILYGKESAERMRQHSPSRHSFMTTGGAAPDPPKS